MHELNHAFQVYLYVFYNPDQTKSRLSSISVFCMYSNPDQTFMERLVVEKKVACLLPTDLLSGFESGHFPTIKIKIL
jgi:hypothetical protein